MTKRPSPLIVPPVTRSPGCFSTGIGSPVSIDSSTERAALDDHAVDRHLLARPHAQEVAALDLVERDVLVVPSGLDAVRRLRREVEQRADRRAGAAAGAQLQHLAEQDQGR